MVKFACLSKKLLIFKEKVYFFFRSEEVLHISVKYDGMNFCCLHPIKLNKKERLHERLLFIFIARHEAQLMSVKDTNFLKMSIFLYCINKCLVSDHVLSLLIIVLSESVKLSQEAMLISSNGQNKAPVPKILWNKWQS